VQDDKPYMVETKQQGSEEICTAKSCKIYILHKFYLGDEINNNLLIIKTINI
jgi:hypothetical protein